MLLTSRYTFFEGRAADHLPGVLLLQASSVALNEALENEISDGRCLPEAKGMLMDRNVLRRGTYSCFPLFLHIITMFHFLFSNLRAFYFWSANLKKLLTKVNLLIRTQQSCILGVMAVVLKIGAGRTASTGHYCSQGAPFTTASSWC
jgi:hypothetical protein